MWDTVRLPSDWTRGVNSVYWKHEGYRLICSNQRGITPISILGKPLMKILLLHAFSSIRSTCRPQQAGLMPSHFITDHISSICLLMEKTYEYSEDRHLYIWFIDLKAPSAIHCGISYRPLELHLK